MSSAVEKSDQVTEGELEEFKDAQEDLPPWIPFKDRGPDDYEIFDPSLKELLKQKKDFLHWELCLLKQDKDSFVETTLTGVQKMIEKTTKKIEEFEKTMKNVIRLYGILKKIIPGLKFSKASLERKFTTVNTMKLKALEATVAKMVEAVKE